MSDRHIALKALNSFTCESRTVRMSKDSKDTLKIQVASSNLNSTWVPGHIGEKENEKAEMYLIKNCHKLSLISLR